MLNFLNWYSHVPHMDWRHLMDFIGGKTPETQDVNVPVMKSFTIKQPECKVWTRQTSLLSVNEVFVVKLQSVSAHLIDQRGNTNWLIDIWLLCQLAAWRLPRHWNSHWHLNASTSRHHPRRPQNLQSLQRLKHFDQDRSCSELWFEISVTPHRTWFIVSELNWASVVCFLWGDQFRPKPQAGRSNHRFTSL